MVTTWELGVCQLRDSKKAGLNQVVQVMPMVAATAALRVLEGSCHRPETQLTQIVERFGNDNPDLNKTCTCLRAVLAMHACKPTCAAVLCMQYPQHAPESRILD